MRGACFEAQYACCNCGGGCFFVSSLFSNASDAQAFPKHAVETQVSMDWSSFFRRAWNAILEISWWHTWDIMSWHWDMKPLLKWCGLCSVFVALSELICKGFCWFVGLQSVVQNSCPDGSIVPAPQKAPVQVPCPFLESCILKNPGMEITRASCLSNNSIGYTWHGILQQH